MLVFGDVERVDDAARLHRSLTAGLCRLEGMRPGPERHAAAAELFLGAAELLRGLLDREAAASGRDHLTPTALAAPGVLVPLARLLDASWRTGRLAVDAISAAHGTLAALDAGGAIRGKPPEGFAFYALYPEAYAEAARRSGLPPSTRVIGIRGIGTSLAAMVAAGLGTDDFVTVRPVGHPFDRTLSVSGALAAHILAGDPPGFAVVDEGPGLSGSSFGAVAAWLEAHGVARRRIHFFPGHAGDPGSAASADRLRSWRSTARHHVDTDELLSGRLEAWVADLVGPLAGPLVDLSWGAWRDQASGGASAPAIPQWERRKFLARTEERRWLVKFAGLGAVGRRKLALARRLREAGFCPEVAGLRHGFLVQRWLEAPNLAGTGVARVALVERIGAYLSFRGGLEAEADGGATLEDLAGMTVRNIREAFGDEAAEAIDARMRVTRGLVRAVRRVETDGRLHRWEWLVDGDRLVKTDALDHARGHDIIGRQDIAWDVAGAIVEHDLEPDETARLTGTIERDGHTVSPDLLAFMLPAYLAFQLGVWTTWTGAASPETRRYTDKLRALLRDPASPQRRMPRAPA